MAVQQDAGEPAEFATGITAFSVGSAGAGDAFTGAFVGSLLQGVSIPEAHSVADHVAAYVCKREGAMPPIPEGLI